MTDSETNYQGRRIVRLEEEADRMRRALAAAYATSELFAAECLRWRQLFANADTDIKDADQVNDITRGLALSLNAMSSDRKKSVEECERLTTSTWPPLAKCYESR
jgi:hypothetical protein